MAQRALWSACSPGSYSTAATPVLSWLLPFSVHGPPSKRQGTHFSASPLPMASHAQTATMCLAPYIQACETQCSKQKECYDVSFLLLTVVLASKGTVILGGCSWHVISLRSSHVCSTCTSEVTGQPAGVVRVTPSWKFVEYFLHPTAPQLHTSHSLRQATSHTAPCAEAERQRSSDRRHHSKALLSR